MAALTGNKYQYMRGAITALKHRMVAHIDYTLTHDDFLEIFVPAHLHDTAVEAPKHFHVPYRTSNVQHTTHLASLTQACTFTVDLHDNKAHHAPMVPRQVVQYPEENPRFLAILDPLEQMADMHRRFALADRVLAELHDRCPTAHHMRFFWPTMLILMENSMDDPTKAAAEKLRAVRAPKSIPSLPTWLRLACKETSEIITAASLIPEKQTVPREVTLSIKKLAAYKYHDTMILCEP